MRYQLAIFDLDGTILDTIVDLTNAMNLALSKHGLPELPLETAKKYTGNGMRRYAEQAVPDGTPPDVVENVLEDFKAIYKVHCEDHTKPYDGIPELLKTLRENGCKTAVISNKGDFAVQILVKQYYEGLFDFAVGEREGLVRRKPAPDEVNAVLEKLGVDRKDAVYIGDSEVDVATAVNAEMDSITVLWGFREKEYLKSQGAYRFAEKPSDVAKIVLE
ncbi:MAG: HAD family hydrolase [Anaerovoracaceae bacterium]|jgi:phosphoglycolate phosphatase